MVPNDVKVNFTCFVCGDPIQNPMFKDHEQDVGEILESDSYVGKGGGHLIFKRVNEGKVVRNVQFEVICPACINVLDHTISKVLSDHSEKRSDNLDKRLKR